jgi:GNAT superfamily N-acetyltransferase
MSIEIRLLGPADARVLENVAPGVFDKPINPHWSAEFLADPRHHLAVAIDEGRVVGMASAVNYVNPDKPSELWINEVGVALTHQRRGVGRQILAALLDRGRALGCNEAWVLTDTGNAAARGLYSAAGGAENSRETPVMVTFKLTDSTLT